MSLLDSYTVDDIRDLLSIATAEEAAIVNAALEAELYDWSNFARDTQLAPDGDWLVWLILAGRGWGKTLTGAEWIKDRAQKLAGSRNALVAATLDDVRDTMIEGESGLLSVLPDSALRGGSRDSAWNRSMCELYLANGSKFKGFSSERPDKLRGPQHHSAWCDEPMSWNDANRGPEEEGTTWSNLMLGLRLGKDPRAVVTGTPKKKRLLVGTHEKPGIMDSEGTVITKGSTYENLDNLAPTFKAKILGLYEGTRTGRQELNAEVLDDVEGALWTSADIEEVRVREAPQMARIVVAVDPAVTSGESSDETGIIVAGRGMDGRGYILADRSGRFTPDAAMQRVVAAYHEFSADRVIIEKNNGGDYLPAFIRTVDPTVPVKTVTATHGKITRAEPVAALYEQRKVSHVGMFTDLETQLTTWVQGDPSPDRLDALVWALTNLLVKGGKFWIAAA